MLGIQVAQHFLLSRHAKTLSLAQIFHMTDMEAEAMFRKVRWPEKTARLFARIAAA